MKRQFFLALAFIIPISAGTCAWAIPINCTIIDLGTLGGNYSIAS